MRDYLFRGKSTSDKKWVYGGIYKVHDNYVMPVYREKDGAEQFISVIPETVGQFTGLTDKNGAKIFEGDIFCAVDTNEFKPEEAEIIIVTWKNESAQFYGQVKHTNYCPFVSLVDSENFILIGNIYDTPELLGDDYTLYLQKYLYKALFGEESSGIFMTTRNYWKGTRGVLEIDYP